MTIPQDIIIQMFLSNPTKALFCTIANKNMALKLLSDLKDSAAKSYFFWQLDKRTNTVMNLVKMSLYDNNSELLHKLINSYYVDFNKAASYAALYNRVEELDYLIQSGATDWEMIARYAARGDNKIILSFMIERGANDWDGMLYNAARGGHRELVHKMLKSYQPEFHYIASGAAKGGHLPIVLDMMERDIYTSTSTRIDHWNEVAFSAIEGGHSEIVRTSIRNGAQSDRMMRVAMLHRRRNIINMLDNLSVY